MRGLCVTSYNAPCKFPVDVPWFLRACTHGTIPSMFDVECNFLYVWIDASDHDFHPVCHRLWHVVNRFVHVSGCLNFLDM